jgi:hypothetical protein
MEGEWQALESKYWYALHHANVPILVTPKSSIGNHL